jgi:hypothetical protein
MFRAEQPPSYVHYVLFSRLTCQRRMQQIGTSRSNEWRGAAARRLRRACKVLSILRINRLGTKGFLALLANASNASQAEQW